MSRSLVVVAVERAAKSWTKEAEERRKISKADPVADTLDYCASELAARLRSIESAAQFDSVEERARRDGVTPQTVRIWIRTGQLTAEDGAKGYKIPRDAKRVQRAG